MQQHGVRGAGKAGVGAAERAPRPAMEDPFTKAERMARAGHPPQVISDYTGIRRESVIAHLEAVGLRKRGLAYG